MTPRRLAATALAIALAGATGPATAGEWTLGVAFVNMTPDARSGATSRACVAAVRKKLQRSDSKVTALGETKLRTMVGKPKGGDPFLTWPGALARKVELGGDRRLDTVVLVDCRPEDGQLDVWMVPPSGGVARIQLRHRPIEVRAAELVGDALWRRAWTGGEP